MRGPESGLTTHTHFIVVLFVFGACLDKVELTHWFGALVSDFLTHVRLPTDVKIGPQQMRKLAASLSKQAGQDEKSYGFFPPLIFSGRIAM